MATIGNLENSKARQVNKVLGNLVFRSNKLGKYKRINPSTNSRSVRRAFMMASPNFLKWTL